MNNRFDKAIVKLYEAFHGNNLEPECACQCAVGTISDGKDQWKHFSDDHGSLRLNYVGRVHETLGRRINGYLPSELLKIEAAFLQGCGYSLPLRHNGLKPENSSDKNIQFQGLESVIKVLCQLEGKSNMMDYTQLFKPSIQIKQPSLISF